MRQIRFRGRSLDNGEWVHGSYIANECAILVDHSDGIVQCIAPETLGQFTGITDDSGTEIYEGDIVCISIHPKAEDAKASERLAKLANVTMPAWMAGGDIIARVAYFDGAFHYIHTKSYLPGELPHEPMFYYLFEERHPEVPVTYDQEITVIGNIHDKQHNSKSNEQCNSEQK